MISKYYVYVFMSASAEMEMCMILEKSAVISILVSKWPGPWPWNSTHISTIIKTPKVKYQRWQYSVVQGFLSPASMVYFNLISLKQDSNRPHWVASPPCMTNIGHCSSHLLLLKTIPKLKWLQTTTVTYFAEPVTWAGFSGDSSFSLHKVSTG